MVTQTPNLLLPIEAAEVLRLSSARVVKLARKGVIPCITMPGGDIRFDAADLTAWIATRRNAARASHE